ncbi:Synaptotagmin-like protein isoform 2 [Schistosoma japonicum]|uniref:Synaptotagmin-like protein isoform 2 n=1 Tax=Schistosoma japonicum TaxID=6182 RepID=A0A4Z2CZS0_SCHJA|nr:Synaptotagmin-like protein isoform 2 [Schistosoma japonicum]
MQELNCNDDGNADGNYHEVSDETDSADDETNSDLSQSSLKKEDHTLNESSDIYPSEKHNQGFSRSSVQQYRRATGTDENVNERTDIGNNDDSRSISLIHLKNEANESQIEASGNIQRDNCERGPVDEQFGVNHQIQHVRYKKSKSLHNSQSLVDSGYVPQRTHSWTDDEIDPTSEKHHSSTPQLHKTSSSKEADLHKQNTGFSSSECYSPSLTSEITSVTDKKLTPTSNELVSARILTTQQKRLDSEVGSNLSVASGVYPDSVQTPTKFNSVKVLNVQDRRRRSSSLNEADFVHLYNNYESTPLSKINETNFNESHTKCLNPAPSFRSLFHIRLDRNNASQGSSLSIYSERESSYTHGIQISGELLMSIIYDSTFNALRVGIKQARDLAIADRKRNVTNPYVKCYLLPDRTKGSKRKTSHKKSTCNPVFDEEFKYYILKQDLASRTLQVTVWHYNVLGLNLFLGEIFLPLTFHQFDEASHWYTLGEHRLVPAASHLQINRGEIVLAIKLVPGETGGNRGEIHVWIKSAKGLSASTDGVASQRDNVDPYVKM